MRKAYKSIISLAVVLIAGLNFMVPAFAQDPFIGIAVGGLTGASGAGLFGSMAGMSGINIGWSQSGSDPMDAMWNVLNPDHVYFSGEKHEATGSGTDIYDYIQVDIGDWLNAQRDFIKNFETSYNVSDNDSGEIYQSIIYGNLKLPDTGNQRYAYLGEFPLTVGTTTSIMVNGIVINLVLNSNKYLRTNATFINGVNCGFYNEIYIDGSTYHNPIPLYLEWRFPGNVRISTYHFGASAYVELTTSTSDTPGKITNADVSWTSGTVNTDVFNDWEGARVKIPHSISQLQTGWTLTDFLAELDRIWTGSGEDNIIIEDSGEDPPVPPVPVPDTPLGDVPFDDWVDLWGQGIYEQLENQSDALDFIGSNGTDAIEELESIDSNLDDLNQTAESIDTNIGIGNGILGGIRSLAQSAVNFLEGIAEHVEELVDEIVEGTETLIAGILNQIPQAFGIILGPIKQASSIWHYVVEWIQSIGLPFQFIWSMASGTSYYIILPVYASLAAAVVLAFYKRFGK